MARPTKKKVVNKRAAAAGCDEVCGVCRFWTRTENTRMTAGVDKQGRAVATNVSVLGICKRYPPQETERLVRTVERDTCGEFRQRNPEELPL